MALLILTQFRAARGFGGWRTALAPSQPYFPDFSTPWKEGRQRRLIEMPAGVSPRMRLPYTGTAGIALGNRLITASLSRNTEPVLTFVVHGVDFLDAYELPTEMRMHPTARTPLKAKLDRLEELLRLAMTGRRSATTLECAGCLRKESLANSPLAVASTGALGTIQ
jgi:hypothetical protein